MSQFKKYGFQKVFGYTDNLKAARHQSITNDKRAASKYVLGIAMTGSISNHYSVFFILLQLVDVSFNSWYVKFYNLHKCNLKMLVVPNVHSPVISLLDSEREYEEHNWYFHIMVLKRFKNYVRSAGGRIKVGGGQARIEGVVKAVDQMISLYDDFPEERSSKMFVGALKELVCEIAVAMQKLHMCIVKPLIPAYEILLNCCKETDLLDVTVSLQVLLEIDKTYTAARYFTEEIWENIEEGVKSENRDIAQSYKDIITYLVISSQKVDIEYELGETTQDVFLRNALKKHT